MEGNIGFLQTFDNLFTQRRAIRISKVAVRYTTLRGIIKSADTALGEVQHVVADNEMACLHLRIDGANGSRRKNLFGTQALNRPDICAIVYLVRRHRMVNTMTADKNNLVAAHHTDIA